MKILPCSTQCKHQLLSSLACEKSHNFPDLPPQPTLSVVVLLDNFDEQAWTTSWPCGTPVVHLAFINKDIHFSYPFTSSLISQPPQNWQIFFPAYRNFQIQRSISCFQQMNNYIRRPAGLSSSFPVWVVLHAFQCLPRPTPMPSSCRMLWTNIYHTIRNLNFMKGYHKCVTCEIKG